MTPPPVKGTRRITLLALLTAIALTIFMIEAQLPVLVPIQGVKLGLANIITVYAVFVLGPGDALLILCARVFLGAVFSGQMMTLLYSMGVGLLAWLAWHRMGQLWPALVVPASAFVVGTLVRKLIDRPRPYTALGFTPLFPKDKTGQSMPGRHCFSAAAIAGTAWYVLPPLGAVLAVLGVLIAISRVVTGVHYISDVLAGLAFGSVFAVLGWNAFVLAASALGFYASMLL